MKIWIDDLRDPKVFGTRDVIWIKEYEEAAQYIDDHLDEIEAIHLDNDLSDRLDRQGRDILKKVEENVFFEKMTNLKEIFIHSDNTPAVLSMMGSKEFFLNRGITVERKSYRL